MRINRIIRQFYRKVASFTCHLICVLAVLSCVHHKENNYDQHAAETAFFEHRYSDVITLLTPFSKYLSATSKFYLARSYVENGQKDKFVDSVALLEDAAELGVTEAAWELARAYDEGSYVASDTLKALDWYRYHALMGRDQSAAPQYFDQQGRPISAQQMIERLTDLANSGDLNAQVQLAKLFGEGANTNIDLHESFVWYEKAARSGHEYSALMLGFYYCRGLGTKMDVVKANYWLGQYSSKISCK